MLLFCVFFYLQDFNNKLKLSSKFEGGLEFSCPVQAAMLVPRKVLIEFI